MKIKKFLFVSILSFGIISCSEKEPLDTDFFEWTDQEAIAPLSMDSEDGLDLSSDYREVAWGLLAQNGISTSTTVTAETAETEAIVINDQAVIKDVVERLGFDSEISESDGYSLVVGCTVVGATGAYRISQRAKKTLGGVSLRLMIEQVGGGFTVPSRTCFMALYSTVLPSGPVRKIYCTGE